MMTKGESLHLTKVEEDDENWAGFFSILTAQWNALKNCVCVQSFQGCLLPFWNQVFFWKVAMPDNFSKSYQADENTVYQRSKICQRSFIHVQVRRCVTQKIFFLLVCIVCMVLNNSEPIMHKVNLLLKRKCDLSLWKQKMFFHFKSYLS